MIFKLRRGTIDLGRVVIQMLMSSGHRGQPAARLNIWTRVPQGRGRSLQDAAALVAPRGRVRSTDCLINSRKIPAERRRGPVQRPGVQFQRKLPELQVTLLLLLL